MSINNALKEFIKNLLSLYWDIDKKFYWKIPKKKPEQFNRFSVTLYFKSQIKQWAETSHKSLDINTYPIRDSWIKILHEQSLIPNDYFNAIYKI